MNSPFDLPIKTTLLCAIGVIAALVWNLWLHTGFDAPIVPWGIVIIIGSLGLLTVLLLVHMVNMAEIMRREIRKGDEQK